MSEVRRFVVTATGDPAALLADLADDAGLRVTSSVVVERTFLDTADGRLAGADVVLELRRPVDGGGVAVARLDWRTGAPSPPPTCPHADAPRFAGDLPAVARRPTAWPG